VAAVGGMAPNAAASRSDCAADGDAVGARGIAAAIVAADVGSKKAKGDVLEKSAGSTAVLVVSGGHKEALP
jgi:hypothetical protein